MQITSFAQLRDIFKNDARHGYLRIKALTPGETVYGFALVTDDDAYAAGTIANTEERLAAFFAKNPIEGFFGRWVQRPLFRWTTDEWPSIYSEEGAPMPPDPPPEASQFADPVEYHRAISHFADMWMAESGKTFREFRATSLRAMVEALRDLDREGLFGDGRGRDKITVFVTI